MVIFYYFFRRTTVEALYVVNTLRVGQNIMITRRIGVKVYGIYVIVAVMLKILGIGNEKLTKLLVTRAGYYNASRSAQKHKSVVACVYSRSDSRVSRFTCGLYIYGQDDRIFGCGIRCDLRIYVELRTIGGVDLVLAYALDEIIFIRHVTEIFAQSSLCRITRVVKLGVVIVKQ